MLLHTVEPASIDFRAIPDEERRSETGIIRLDFVS